MTTQCLRLTAAPTFPAPSSDLGLGQVPWAMDSAEQVSTTTTHRGPTLQPGKDMPKAAATLLGLDPEGSASEPGEP